MTKSHRLEMLARDAKNRILTIGASPQHNLYASRFTMDPIMSLSVGSYLT
jgi:hypothetical protein